PKTITPRPKRAASKAPTKAPKAVPASRCQEMARDEPKFDCTTTRAEIGAHQTSGNPSNRAASNATTAAIVVLAGYMSLAFHDAGCGVAVPFILESFYMSNANLKLAALDPAKRSPQLRLPRR